MPYYLFRMGALEIKQARSHLIRFEDLGAAEKGVWLCLEPAIRGFRFAKFVGLLQAAGGAWACAQGVAKWQTTRDLVASTVPLGIGLIGLTASRNTLHRGIKNIPAAARPHLTPAFSAFLNRKLYEHNISLIVRNELLALLH